MHKAPNTDSGTPAPGEWLWTCREGFEAYLNGELQALRLQPRLLGPALLASAPFPAGARSPAFARAGFLVAGVQLASDAQGCAALLCEGPLVVQGWVPDTAAGNRHAEQALALEEQVGALLKARGAQVLSALHEVQRRSGTLAQLCVLGDGRVAVGQVQAQGAISIWPGGRRRMRRATDAPSRAAMKLEEALDGLPFGPSKGEVCVDLGAAPGGWSQRLLERGARVIAVDPAKLSPELMRHKKLTHVQDSAFTYAPQEPVDWLCCDMAWRPLEVAQLLAKWARRGWAAHLVANIKLPMKDKLPVVNRVRATLESGGWKQLTIRQLYHDRDEVTVTALDRG